MSNRTEYTVMLHTARADAYGAGLEYVKPEVVASSNDLSRYLQHPTHALKPGQYTDDTQMAVAVLEALLSGKPLTTELFTQSFVDCFKRDQREGYAGGFYKFLCSVTDAADFLAKIKPDSDKSGAAMRAVPVGILPTIAEVLSVSKLQAAITHNTVDGIAAAQASSLAGHYFFYNLGARKDLGAFLEKHVPGHKWNTRWEGKVGQQGWMSARAAFTAIMENDSMSALLRQCIAYTGDVDTVAAIACGAAAASSEVKQDLPAVLTDTLENGTYGKDYLIGLDRKLSDAVAKYKANVIA